MDLVQGMVSFLKQIEANQLDITTRHVFGDWLEENGLVRWEAFGATTPLGPFDVYSFGSGSGSGIGIGSGFGSGRGSGIGSGIGSGRGRGFGSGRGIGSGIGSGSGRGRGIGSGFGSGSGNGSGSGFGSGSGSQGVLFMEVGKRYLVHCGDWHTFVGKCVGMISPVVYVMESVSKISNTNNNDNWQELVEGNAASRKKATYIHYKTRMTVPLTIAAFEWVGMTPQEEGL